MISSMKINLLTKRNINPKSFAVFSTSHLRTQQVPAIKSDNSEKQLKDFQTITNVTKKIRIKKPQKPPFVKNLLLGKFDTDMLTYPELNKEDTKNLEDSLKQLKNLIKLNHMKDSCALSKEFRQNLSDYKAIGLQAAQLMDGREFNVTESSAFLEVLSEHKLRNRIVNNEQLGIQILNKFANDQLKLKYLKGLMNGELLSATCFYESTAIDLNDFKTKAELSSDKKNWVLNGFKNFVVNGQLADIFIVFAVTNRDKKDILVNTYLTAFVVERDFPGISIQEIDSKGTEMITINFDETLVPAANVIGEVNKAQKYFSSILAECRLSVSPMCIAVSKQILNNLVTDVRSNSNDKNILHEVDSVQEKMGEMVMLLYAMESMLYLTSGLTDNYEGQDIEVESAIVKAFSSNQTMKFAMTAVELSGMGLLSNSHWLYPLLQEAICFKTINESDDNLKIILSLLCLQHVGKSIGDIVTKIRNPLFHIGVGFERMWKNRRNVKDNPKLNLNLGDFLHPSLYDSSQKLEYCVKRIEFAAEMLLIRYGPEILNYHMDVRRLSECIIDTYAIAACLSRSSRSYCIGLQHGSDELALATAFTNVAYDRVKKNVSKILGGYHNTNDENYRLISKRIFKFKEYFVKHPISRNF